MPRLTYTPEGADPKVWDFSFGRLLSPERIAIEKLTGLGWVEVQKAFWSNRGEVVHALLWVLLKREIPTLRADEVVFCDDEIDLDLTDTEAAEAAKEMRKNEAALDDAERAALRELEERTSADPKAD